MSPYWAHELLQANTSSDDYLNKGFLECGWVSLDLRKDRHHSHWLCVSVDIVITTPSSGSTFCIYNPPTMNEYPSGLSLGQQVTSSVQTVTKAASRLRSGTLANSDNKKQEFSWMQFSVCFSLNHTRSPPCYRRHCCCCSGWLLLVALFIHSPAMADRKDVCISCNEVFLEGNGNIRCNDWEFRYHFGASSGLSQGNYI